MNESVLRVIERPALAWLAARMPDRVQPDHLTLLGLAGSILTAAGYLLSARALPWLWLATAGLLLNWVGDSLDGTLARTRGAERPRYGFAVDHGSDLFSQTLVFLSLGASPCARFGVACLGLVAFLMVFVHSLIHLHVRGTLRISYFGFGPTEIRGLLVAGNLLFLLAGPINLAAWWPGHGVPDPFTPFDLVILVLAGITPPLLAGLLWADLRRLDQEEPAPAARSRRDQLRS